MNQENTVLVDTPGIGPNVEITQKLMEYLPNAVSFIFVITVANAGGMQNDRVSQGCIAIDRVDNKEHLSRQDK